MKRPPRIHTYTTVGYDGGRWDGFEPRRGDIIVATPVKSGTTWTQMICELLLHQSHQFPEPLIRLSHRARISTSGRSLRIFSGWRAWASGGTCSRPRTRNCTST